MNHITKFVEFLNENQEWSKEDLEDFLLPFRDLGIKVYIRKKKEIITGEFGGREFTEIGISLDDFKKVKYAPGMELNLNSIYDERIWGLLDELSMLKRRLESDKVFIHMTTSEITIAYLHSEIDKNSDLYKVKKLKSQIDFAHRTSKSDFANQIVSKIIDEKLIVDCSAFYTRRKWNNLTRSIDFSDFNLEFDEYNSSSIYDGCKITISLK